MSFQNPALVDIRINTGVVPRFDDEMGEHAGDGIDDHASDPNPRVAGRVDLLFCGTKSPG
jgi:hypothetical protein